MSETVEDALRSASGPALYVDVERQRVGLGLLVRTTAYLTFGSIREAKAAEDALEGAGFKVRRDRYALTASRLGWR